MTKIDRYILVLFLRTVLICFCSLAGIFIVFHAFTSMDDLVKQGQAEDGLIRVMMRYYGPYMLLLFDWTGAIIALMAFLFSIGWLRRTGELTAVLSAGISHGRIFRPILIASLAIVLIQLRQSRIGAAPLPRRADDEVQRYRWRERATDLGAVRQDESSPD